MYRKYDVTLKFRERVCGGIPLAKDIVDGWLRGQGVKDAEARARIAEELDEAMDWEQVVEQKLEEKTVGFLRRDGGLYVEARQVRALLKEMANVSGATRDYGGAYGLKNLLQHGVVVKPKYIPLGVQEPDDVKTGPVHAQQTALKRLEYVMQPEISFQVWALSSNPLVRSRPTKESGKKSFDELLEWLFKAGEENGFGADRSQDEGKYDLVKFERVQ